MSGYRNEIRDRFRIAVNEDGARDHSYVHGVQLSIRTGWNPACEFIMSNLSIEELRDLRYLIERAIAAAESSSPGIG